MEQIKSTDFIVITGAPQTGKSERISKVRSHITKRYLRRKHAGSQITSIVQKSLHNGVLETPGTPMVPQARNLGAKPPCSTKAGTEVISIQDNVETPPLYPTMRIKLDPMFLESETNKRMHQCK
jgi:hypothetical protein